MQYFQRARFEYRADLPEGQRVQLTQLGRETYLSTGPLNVSNTFACRTYPETGYPVCFAFLEFFDQYGGVSQFGYPISGFEYHENKIVQYFEKARLEWQPWKMEGQRVVVSDLGRMYFDKLGEDIGLLSPVKPLNNTSTDIVNLQVRAFVWKAVTLATDSQLIFVIVQDQNLQPVANASCTTLVHWPDGRAEPTTLTTNTNGVGMVPLSFTSQPYGSLIYTDVAMYFWRFERKNNNIIQNLVLTKRSLLIKKKAFTRNAFFLIRGNYGNWNERLCYIPSNFISCFKVSLSPSFSGRGSYPSSLLALLLLPI